MERRVVRSQGAFTRVRIRDYCVRRHMELHLAITCPKSQVDCICGETLLRETQPVHSETVCAEHPIKCEFDHFGCTQMIKRKDMQLRIVHVRHESEWFVHMGQAQREQ